MRDGAKAASLWSVPTCRIHNEGRIACAHLLVPNTPRWLDHAGAPRYGWNQNGWTAPAWVHAMRPSLWLRHGGVGRKNLKLTLAPALNPASN